MKKKSMWIAIYGGIFLLILLIPGILFFSVIIEDISIGGWCGTYIPRKNWHNPMGCTCIGIKKSLPPESGINDPIRGVDGEEYTDYQCTGIRIYTGYE